MGNPGQSIPPDEMPNASQGTDTRTTSRSPDRYGDTNDPLLDANEVQTLEHGGYGGEQEYLDSSMDVAQPSSTADAGDGEYINQTDMADQTGDSSISEAAQRTKQMEQEQRDDESVGDDMQ